MSIGQTKRPSMLIIAVGVGLVVVVWLLMGSPAFGVVSAEQPPSGTAWWSDPNGLLSEDRGVTGGLVLKTVVSLVFVLGLGVAAAYGLRRLGPRFGRIQGKEIRVVETTALGPKRALHIVEAAGQRFLIGSTPDHVTLLAPLSSPLTQPKTDPSSLGRGT